MEKTKLLQLQAECVEVNIILHDVQKQLGLKFNETDLLNWTECGAGEYITELFKLATGRNPNETEYKPGYVKVEALEAKHIETLTWDHGIFLPLIERTFERLKWINTLIDKYDFEVVDGRLVISGNDIVMAVLNNNKDINTVDVDS